MMTVTLNDEVAALLEKMAQQANTPPDKLLSDLIKRNAVGIHLNQGDFFTYAGLWQDRAITQEALRAQVWKKPQ